MIIGSGSADSRSVRQTEYVLQAVDVVVRPLQHISTFRLTSISQQLTAHINLFSCREPDSVRTRKLFTHFTHNVCNGAVQHFSRRRRSLRSTILLLAGSDYMLEQTLLGVHWAWVILLSAEQDQTTVQTGGSASHSIFTLDVHTGRINIQIAKMSTSPPYPLLSSVTI